MKKPEKVLRYYILCNKLKNIIRTGWLNWHVEAERVESIAEHIFGVQMLALAMYSEYNYKKLDIQKVIMMLAVHELEEIVIGDLTMFQITHEEKEQLGHEAIKEILKGLLKGEEIQALILEFDERKTKEAKFAYYCDKLECDIQAKLYGEKGLVDLNNQKDNITMNNKDVQELLKSGKTWEEMWLIFGQQRYNYDKHFLEVSNYALNNDISKLGSL